MSDEREQVNKDAETEQLDPVIEALGSLAHKIARNLPDEKKSEMHKKMVGDELKKLIHKLHFINGMFGGLSESAIIGVVVDELFYEVKVTTKEFQSEAEANDYAQVRHDEVTK